MKKGTIVINPKWNLSERRQAALERLSELGVSVESNSGKTDYLIEVPVRPNYAEYIEIGYLIAQLGDERFPNDCKSFTANPPAPLLPNAIIRKAAVRFKESHPDYMQFVVTPKIER
jgi:hypothetical protein